MACPAGIEPAYSKLEIWCLILLGHGHMIAVSPACLFRRSNLLAFRPAPLFYSPSGSSSRVFLERPLIFFSGSFYHSYLVFKDRREVSPRPFNLTAARRVVKVGRLIFFAFRFSSGAFLPAPLFYPPCGGSSRGARFLFLRRFSFATGVFPSPLYLIHLLAERQGIF